MIELKDYPVPEGIVVPNLMPYQLRAWNGDYHLAAEVLRLKEAHWLNLAIETGTCLGSTTLWLEENFPYTYTFEVCEEYRNIARARFNPSGRISMSERSSPIGLELLLDGLLDTAQILFFLDAHWGPNCPLLDELEAIAEANLAEWPCIVIHDFQVPGTDFGFDKMPDGRPFNLELIAGHLDRIYGEAKWWFNYPKEVAGAKRGWISIEPT